METTAIFPATRPDPVLDAPSPGPSSRLGIREARSWATWQLAVVALVFLILGMMLGYAGKKPSATGARVASGVVSLYGPGGPPTTRQRTVTTSPGGSAAAAGTGGLGVPTTVPTTATTAPAATQSPSTVLMPNTTGSGPSDLAPFTSGPSWSAGWVFNCVLAPGGTAMFTIKVVNDGTGASTTLIQQTDREANGITPQTSAGRQHLRVITDPACRWGVKVVGQAG